MKLLKTVVAEKPLDAVFGYLSDFTTTTDWDPGTDPISPVSRDTTFRCRQAPLRPIVIFLGPAAGSPPHLSADAFGGGPAG